ncbi:YbaB/EbfC family nucleoid-associated protein [candidate division TA06 bacterium]|nr:YbaB/EbfC family nucleoid-associated protein [candidate division TA06 bacterium]
MMDFLNLMNQAKDIQAKLGEVQKELSTKRVEVTTGGGMITVVADGQQLIVSLKIDPQLFDRENVEMVEDLIVAAVNEAKRRSQEVAAEEMKRLTGGLNVQGLLNKFTELKGE